MRWQQAVVDGDALATRIGRPDIPLTKQYSVGLRKMLCGGCWWLDDFFVEILLKNFTSDTKDLWCRWLLVSISLKLNPLFLLSSSLSNKSKFSLTSFFFWNCWLEFELNDSSDDEKLYRESLRLPDSSDEDDDCISLNSMSKSKSVFCSTVNSSNFCFALI